MLQEVWEQMNFILGLNEEGLTFWQMAARAPIVYITTIIMIRIGEKRFIGKSTAFDVVLGIVLGSVVSRAITGNAPFFPTLGAGFILVGLHWLLAWGAFQSHRFGTLVKGNSRILVEDGEIVWEGMKKGHISERDLKEALRSEIKSSDLSRVKLACLERSGKITVIPAESPPKILEVKVAEGVQTVRIQLES